MVSRFCFIVILLLCVLEVRSQTAVDTTLQLPAVEVTALSTAQAGSIVQSKTWSDSTLASIPTDDLGNFLNENTTVFVKQFGGVSSATASIRGGAASQVALLWNGVNIQNNMLAISDLSLLNTTYFDNIALEYGGNTALHGSGALSGTILLNSASQPGQDEIARLGIDFGSFGAFRVSGRANAGTDRLTSSTRIIYNRADNDFRYSVTGTDRTRIQEHAQLAQGGVLQELGYQFNPKHAINARVWWQRSDRQLPPTRVQNASDAEQEDESLRAMLDYTAMGQRSMYTVRTGVFTERLDYSEPSAGVEAMSRQINAFIIGEANWLLGKQWNVMAGVNHHWLSAETLNYTEGMADQRRMAFYSSAEGAIGKRLTAEISVRMEMVNGELIPPAGAVAFRYRICNQLGAYARVSRDYRLPGLNDLFWAPGGNRELQTEHAWAEEVGLNYSAKRLGISVIAFNRNTDNWIMWAPVEGQNFWGAYNLTEVWSRGIQTEVRYAFTVQSVDVALNGSYGYVASTNEMAIETPALEKGAQLIYTPEHQGNMHASIGWKSISMSYDHIFRGAVNTEFGTTLPGYQIGNMRLNGTLEVGKIGLSPHLEINNLWNADYEIVARRPMPGRNYRIGITLKINK